MLAGRWSALVATAPAGRPSRHLVYFEVQQTTAARGRFAYERHRPAIAYSRVGTGRTPSAVPSSSNFPASHLGSEPRSDWSVLLSVFHLRHSGRPIRLPRPRNDIVSQQIGPCAVVVCLAGRAIAINSKR